MGDVMSITRIAEAAQVSYATAWRIINNLPCRSEQSVKAVRRAMGEMGYDPAEGRKRGRRPKSADGIRTHNVALLHLRAGTAISNSVLRHVERLLAERNLNLIFGHVEGNGELPQAVRAGNVDGILGYGQFPAEALTEKLQRVPAVWMMSRSDAKGDPWGDRVKPDHHAIGLLAAEYLLKRGHRCVGYINPASELVMYQERLAAFRTAVEAAGGTVRVYARGGAADVQVEAGRLVEQWMGDSPRPTALFVPTDRATVRVYRELEGRGVRPGRDVDVVSCDNEKELLSLMEPAPASVDLNRETVARLAVERLLWRMKNGQASPRAVITVSPTLGAQGVAA